METKERLLLVLCSGWRCLRQGGRHVLGTQTAKQCDDDDDVEDDDHHGGDDDFDHGGVVKWS